jgi:hypothetical protein
MEPTTMDAAKILHELTYAEGLPREALKAASAQRGEMVSLFLEEIETYLALEPAGRAMPTPLFFIFHLLGEWREKATYRQGAVACARRNRSRVMACSSNATRSAAATEPCVGRTQAVGHRVIPLVRINSATASQSFSGMIHPISSRAIGRAVIVEFSARLSRGSVASCDGM